LVQTAQNLPQYTSLVRHPDESFVDYKARRTLANKAVKALKKGVLVWDAGYAGTYVNKEKQAAKAARAARKAQRKNPQ
jgi:hypothetical protein